MTPDSTYTPTTLGYAILGLLQQEPRSGYGVRKVFETTPMGHYSSSPGAIYPALRRLQQEGLVHQIADPVQPSRDRKVFSTTPQGVAALAAWLNKPIAQEDVVRRLPELLLRFAFMDHLVAGPQKVLLLRSFKGEIDVYIGRLAQLREAERDAMPLPGLLALDNGIECYKTHSRWAIHAIKTLEGNETIEGP